MRWPRYGQMKASGVAWLGEVPGHWDVKRLKRVVHVSGGMTPDKSEPDFWDGDMPWVTAKDMKSLRLADSEDHVSPSALRATGLKPVTPPASLIVVRGMILAHTFPVAEIDAPVTINQDMKALRPAADLAPGYLAWMLRGSSGYVLSIADESAHGTKALRTDRLFEMQIPLPPADEQRAIAAFLDRETARIDALVAAKRRLIGVLQERRAALIARAVTRGLDPDVSTKDSGVPWLGRVPVNWDVMPLKHAVRFQRGHDLPADERRDGDVPVVSSAGVSAWHDEAIAAAPGITTGRYGTIGQFTYVEEPYWPLNTVLYSIDIAANHARFLWWMLHLLKPLFVLNSQKSAVPGVDRNDLHPVLIAVPPRLEQEQIAAHLDAPSKRHSLMESAIAEAISRLTEYRSTLITSAVTGRIDVRGAA